MINLYREVASLLGLELNEEFAFSNRWFRFTEQGLEIYDDTNGYILTEFGSAWLGKIVDKPEKVNKIVWKPKYNETYFVPHPLLDRLCEVYIWVECPRDRLALERHLVFKTSDEAVKVAKEWISTLKGGKPHGKISQTVRSTVEPLVKFTVGDRYYFPCPASIEKWDYSTWSERDVDYYRLNRGFACMTKERAVAISQEMLKDTRVIEEE